MLPSGLQNPAALSVLILLALVGQAQAQICSASLSATVPEDTAVGSAVTQITIEEGVALTLPNDFAGTFAIEMENQLVLKQELDYETTIRYSVKIDCLKGAEKISIVVVVVVTNVNDNPPEFAQTSYTLTIDELLTVGTSVGTVTATDKDTPPPASPILYYSLDPNSQEYFELETRNNPTFKVKKLLDYDVVQMVTFKLVVQDTSDSTPPSFTATTEIIFEIIDIDNRPPWFQPCVLEQIGHSKICLGEGYHGKVTLTEQTPGILPLEPSPMYAVDGDKNANAGISYKILSGNVNEIFYIGGDSGNITMLKPADVAGPIVLNVMAYQTDNADQFTTTTVTFQVMEKSATPPRFEKDVYEGHISLDAGVGSLVLEGKDSTKPLLVQAIDEDYADGINPNVEYELEGSPEFSITKQGFIIMATKAPPGPLSFKVRAMDTASGDEVVTSVDVEVAPETPTTTAMPSTTADMSTATTEVATSSAAMTDSSLTSAAPTQEGAKIGVYSVEDMAAVGATLGVLLLICIALIAVMAVHVKGHSSHHKKIKEISHFHSNLASASAGMKEGVQYSNEGFQYDGDDGASSASGGSRLSVESVEMDQRPARARAGAGAGGDPHYETVVGDAASLAESGRSGDTEGKEVKPILTKERRDDEKEGYKAVWFKQDIDPNTKGEEVTIIPDRTEQDEDEDGDDDREEDDESLDGESSFPRSTGTNLDANSDDDDDDDYPQTSDL